MRGAQIVPETRATLEVKAMYTERLARLVADATYESLSSEAVSAAKRAVLDTIGVTLAGSSDDASGIMVGHVKALGGKREASVFASAFKTSAPLAALANGMMAHVLDYDDGAWAWFGHASAVVLPAVLAVCESRQSTGKDVILGHVVGLEAAARIGLACGDRAYLMGWHNTSTIGSIGAAMGASKILKLDEKQTAVAIGIAASLASGLLKANVGTMTKPFHAGHGAENGVSAALLADRGFTASHTALEGEFGFCRIFNGGGEYWPDRLTDGFGSPWNIATPGLLVKPYPSCRSTHPGIDAALYIRKTYRPDPTKIREIEFRTSNAVEEILQHHRPRVNLEGRFSLEYCAALALLHGEVALKHFMNPGWFTDAQVQQLVAKAKYVHPPGWERGVEAPQEVLVKMADGSVYSKLVGVHDTSGDPGNPMTEAEIVSKYHDCASLVMSAAEVEQSLEMVRSLEHIGDISQLMHVVSGKTANRKK